jgi:hypothetical protein
MMQSIETDSVVIAGMDDRGSHDYRTPKLLKEM